MIPSPYDACARSNMHTYAHAYKQTHTHFASRKAESKKITHQPIWDSLLFFARTPSVDCEQSVPQFS